MRLVLLCVLVLASPLQAEELSIGALFPLTGFAADVGKSELNATLMAVDEINQAGGVAGRKIKLIVEDERSDFNATATAIRKLIAVDRVPVVLGPTWIEFCEIAAPIAESSGVVLLTASGFSAGLTRNRRFVFTTMASHESALAPFSARIARLAPQRLVLLKAQNSYYDQLTAILRRQLEGLGVTIRETVEVMPGENSFRPIIARLKQADMVVLFIGIGSETGNFLKQARELKFKARLLSSHNVLFDEIVNRERALADGLLLFQYYTNAAQSFLERYRARFGMPPIYSAPMAYDNVFLVKQAVEKCGMAADRIRFCLQEIDYSGASGRIRFGPDHRRRDEQRITRLLEGRDGEYRPVAE